MKFQEINFVKGAAIIWIVLFHMYKDFPGYFISGNTFYGNSVSHFIMHGSIGVNLFVICSGFLLSYSATRKNETLFEFYINRLKRLLPLYYCAVAFVLCSDAVIGSDNFSLNWISFFQHIFLVHTFTENMFDIQGTWWYMGMIVQFYLFFPVINSITRKVSIFPAITGAFLIVIIARQIHFFNIDSNYSVFAFVPDFIFGAYIFRYKMLQKSSKKFITAAFVYSALTAFLYFFIAFWAKESLFSCWSGLARPIIASGFFTGLVIIYNMIIKLAPHINGIFIFWGVYSYAVYLFHRPLIYKFVSTLSPYLYPAITTALFISFMALLGWIITNAEKKFLVPVLRRPNV